MTDSSTEVTVSATAGEMVWRQIVEGPCRAVPVPTLVIDVTATAGALP